MKKIQKFERQRVDVQNQMNRAARNFFLFAEKNKKRTLVIAAAKKKSIEKIKDFQAKAHLLSAQKIDLANKLMQFAEMNLENYQIESRKRDQKQAEKEKDKLKKVTDN